MNIEYYVDGIISIIDNIEGETRRYDLEGAKIDEKGFHLSDGAVYARNIKGHIVVIRTFAQNKTNACPKICNEIIDQGDVWEHSYPELRKLENYEDIVNDN